VIALGVFLALFRGQQAAIIIVLIPFLLASFITMLVGIVLSIRHWGRRDVWSVVSVPEKEAVSARREGSEPSVNRLDLE
jgi:hypothetical protein